MAEAKGKSKKATKPKAKPSKKTPASKKVGVNEKGKPKKKMSRGKKILLGVSISLLTLAMIGFLAGAALWISVTIPDPNADFTTNTTIVYYRDGKTQLGTFQVQNRRTIAYEDIPKDVRNAIVASENRTFWSDPGFSIPSLFRAGMGVFSGEDLVGASTITQQYVKVLYLTQERTLNRKVKEVILAAKIGQERSKEEILANYLNTVYYGRGAYGIEAASLAFFKKTASKLELPESVVLSAVINNPAGLDPANGDKQKADLLERYQYTLNSMVEMKYITQAQRDEIYLELPKFPKQTSSSRFGGPKGFLLDMVRTELLGEGFAEDQIMGGGLRIITTFDKDDQDAIVKAAQDITREAAGNSGKAKDLHAAAVSVDNETGGVLAVYGGPDFVENSRNWAKTPRPVGSTFKPYALVAGLRDSWTLYDTVNGSNFTPKGDKTPVRNAGRNWGRITLLNATTHSVNSAYVDLVQQMLNGPAKVFKAANDAGVPADDSWEVNRNNRVALGTSEISPMSQAAGYSTFANNGFRHKVHVVKEILDMNKTKIYSASEEAQQTIEADVVQDVNFALTKVTQDGTGSRAARLGFPVAGKTGTAYQTVGKTSKTVASWFVGYTRQITTAVMFVAGDSGTDNLDDYTRGFYGSGYPSMLWLQYMETAMKDMERKDFDGPTDKRSIISPPKIKPSKTPKPSETASTPTTSSAAQQPVVPPVAPPAQPVVEPTPEKSAPSPHPEPPSPSVATSSAPPSDDPVD